MSLDLVPLSEAKVHFHELVRHLVEAPALLLRHGRPVAVMLDYVVYSELLQRVDDLEDRLAVYESREETPDSRTSWDKLKAEAGFVEE